MVIRFTADFESDDVPIVETDDVPIVETLRPMFDRRFWL